MLKSRDAVKIFTSQAIDSIVDDNFSLLFKILRNYLNHDAFPIKVSDVFDLTLNKSAKDYKGEYFFKNTIANKILLKRHSPKTATMLSEFRIGANKADCVILNGISTCYEIKTEFDNLSRLPEQLNSYTKIFDKVYVVVAKNHIENVLNIIPKEVGIIELTPKGALKEICKATLLNTIIDPALMIQSLRKDEYTSIVKKIFGNIPDLSNMQLYTYCTEKFQTIPSDSLRKLFRISLKEYRKNDFSFIEKLPNSLISSAICYNLTKSKKQTLINILNKYIREDEKCTFQLCGASNTN